MADPSLQGAAYNALVRQVRNEEDTCWLCGRPIDYDAPPRTRWSFSLDHVIPRSKNGLAFDRDNAHAAHYGCNSARGNRDPKPPLITSRDW